MSQSIRDFERSFTSTADMSASATYNGLFRVVKLDGNANAVVQAGADTDKVIGVCQNKPAAGGAAIVRFLGTSKCIASAAISIGDKVTAAANGTIATTTTDKKNVFGIALEAATNAGDIIEVMLTVAATLSI